jgi:hypothetical protein
MASALGDDAGEEVVNWIRHAEANDTSIADRMDMLGERVDRAGERMERRFEAFQVQMERQLQTYQLQMEARLDARLDARFAEFHRVISAEIGAKFNELLKWSFVFWAGAVAAIAALAPPAGRGVAIYLLAKSV